MMEPVKIGNILIAHDRLAELDESRIVASVSRENFRSGEITVSRVCKHPYGLSLLAIAIMVLGLLTAWGLIMWLMYGGKISRFAATMIVLLPSGSWLLREAWRRAPMIFIQTHHGAVRFEFKGPLSQETIAALEQAAQERGYVLQRATGTWR